MNFKSILTGFAAFLTAGSFVYAYSSELQAATGAYINDENVCIAWNAPNCAETGDQQCEQNVEGTNRQMLQNLGAEEHGEPTECGSQLFRLSP